MEIDLQTERYLINKYVGLTKLYDSLGIDYRVNGNMLCPYHHNTNTPSAHLYKDENGYRVWCFSEGKMYGAWDTYKIFMPGIDTNKLAQMIFDKLPENIKQTIANEVGNDVELEVLPYKSSLIKFKQHKISTTQLLQDIANSYQDS